jgi:hypothetical protein
VLGATALAAVPIARGSDTVATVSIRVAVVAVVALTAILVVGWARLLPLPLVTIAGLYAAQLAVDDEPLDAGVALVAAGLFLTTELAYWSLEERAGLRVERGELLRRIAVVAALALGALVLASAVLALADGLQARGLAIDLVGAAAAAAALAAVALLARARAGGGAE